MLVWCEVPLLMCTEKSMLVCTSDILLFGRRPPVGCSLSLLTFVVEDIFETQLRDLRPLGSRILLLTKP